MLTVWPRVVIWLVLFFEKIVSDGSATECLWAHLFRGPGKASNSGTGQVTCFKTYWAAKWLKWLGSPDEYGADTWRLKHLETNYFSGFGIITWLDRVMKQVHPIFFSIVRRITLMLNIIVILTIGTCTCIYHADELIHIFYYTVE
jgi:hypothetical protein